MKRIDKYGLEKCGNKYIGNFGRYDQAKAEDLLISDFVDFCNEEIKTVPRIATINTIEEYEKLLDGRTKLCMKTECLNCEFCGSKDCTTAFLGEEIEVE